MPSSSLSNSIHPLEIYSNSHIINNQTGQKRISQYPALFPFELECGCMLPYATPLSHDMITPTKLSNNDDDNKHSYSVNSNIELFNPSSLLLNTPASSPHPFIPTNYLYESVPPKTSRLKFIPNRNILSLPTIIPDQILDEFDIK